MKVRILGGGVAGLGCALALTRLTDIEHVAVHERETALTLPRKLGHGLMLMRNGVSALRTIGCVHLLDGSTSITQSRFLDAGGRTAHHDDLDDVFCMTRAAIVQGLLDQLDPDMLVLDQHCEGVTLCGLPHAQRVSALHFRGQPSIEIDDDELVIDATGWRSAICDALNPGFERPISRVHEVVTSTDMPDLAAEIGCTFIKTQFPERGVAFGLLAPTAERVIGYLQFDAERYTAPGRGGSQTAMAAFLYKLLHDAPPLVRRYLETVDLRSAHVWRPANADLPQRLSCANAVLIGDAAHPLLPFTSQGVSAALEDAVVLARTLSGLTDPHALLGSDLARMCVERRAAVQPWIDGGRRILESFVDPTSGFFLPYLNGAAPESSVEGDPLFAHHRIDMQVLRERAHNLRWAEQDPDVVPLTAADPDFSPATCIQEAIVRYVRGGPLSYGPSAGLASFRGAVAEHMRHTRSMRCDPDQVFATNSAASALYLAASWALEPGDEVLIPDPVDFLLERSVVARGGVVRRYPLHRSRGWSFDPREVEAMITPRTRMLSLCNPHNPLGRVWRRDELEALADIAVRHDLWLMSDEVWSDIVFDDRPMIPMASLGPEVASRTFTVYGFSKGYGLAGLRLGTLLCPTAPIADAIADLSHANATAYGVSTVSQVAGIAALQEAGDWQRRFVAHLQRQRDLAVAHLNRMPGVSCHVPEGTFVVFPDVSSYAMDEARMTERLLRDGRVALVPGSPAFFGPQAAGHLRISLATSRTLLNEGLDRMEATLGEWWHPGGRWRPEVQGDRVSV